MDTINKKKHQIASYIQLDDVSFDEIISLITLPTEMDRGDLSLACFKLAKKLRSSPKDIAEKIANMVMLKQKDVFDQVEAVNGYVNFKFNRITSANLILREVVSNREAYGNSCIGADKTICIDYSSINIAKLMHIGHLSSTVIGGALCKIYNKLGFKTVGINHLGDWGTQFGKLIVAYRLWCEDKNPKGINVSRLTELYVKFHAEAELDPGLNDQARSAFKDLENGDTECVRLFELFKKTTLDDVKEIYNKLHVEFDSYNGESFYNDKMQPVLDELESLGLVKLSDGARVVDLSQYDMPPCLLVRTDGATLYATRDLAAAFYRKKAYDFYKCLYVVAYQQNLHFKQIFKVIELSKKPWYNDLVHVQFGMVSLEDGAMSTRRGNVVLLRDVLDRAVEKSLHVISTKNPSLKDKETTAKIVGVGAVIFFALSNNRIKDTVFSYDKVLSFEGETAPYVQYTNVRALSILRKLNIEIDEYLSAPFTQIELASLSDSESEMLLTLIERFPAILTDVIEKYEPSLLARYILDLAKAFNRFYLENSITNALKHQKRVRVAIVYATHIVIKEGLRLLGIEAPNEM
ncbi:MAG: arginine--tRNA ligase [Christensenellaceae bacterium]|jgi:arginyl-tRNA synthetase|nr:arginine--tRNA ligase [Christensenellaceae bacterium]